MQLIPIKENIYENTAFIDSADCADSLFMTVEFFKKIGYHPPWIGYYAQTDEGLVGSAAYKGKPVNGKVEIAYGTFPNHRNKGIGAEICRQLVLLSLQTDPSLVITARTLPQESYSTKILKKNNFRLLGSVQDPEDGEVWE